MNDALIVSYHKVEEIQSAARNARTHSDAQISQIVAAIAEFGFTSPILVDESMILIAGHGRLAAAKKLGMDEIACIQLAGLSDAQKRALALADNRLPLSAGWDRDILRIELDELSRIDEVDIAKLGFSQKELKQLLGGGDQTAAQLESGFQFRLIVDCESEQHQSELLEQFESEGLKCRPLIS
jgi:ParB-like chromosome segregation protein Spo0J